MSEFIAKKFRLKDDREIIVRSATTEDAPAIMELVSGVFKTSSYLVTEPDEFSVTLEQEQSWIESFMTSPNSVLLVAQYNGQLVGILDFRGGQRRKISHTGLIGTSVRSEFRSMGVGSTLLSVLVEWAKLHSKIERIELSVFADNAPAIAVYKKLGFVEEGRKKKAFKLSDGRYFDELLMAKTL